MKFLAFSRIGYERLFAGLGIDSGESFRERAQAIRNFVPIYKIRVLC